MAYFDRSRIISVFKYLPKGKGWLSLGRSRAHTSDVIDLQFFDDPGSSQARLFSVGTDKRLIEYDIDRRFVLDSTMQNAILLNKLSKIV